MKNNEKFNQLLNNCQNPRAVYAALLVLAKSATLDKLREEARQHGANT